MSAMTVRPSRSRPARRGKACSISLRYAPVSVMACISPCSEITAWILVPNPPRLRPSACGCLPLAPAAWPWARTAVLSTNRTENSESSPCIRCCSLIQRPETAQRRNRRYMVFHGPKRQWRSLQGQPVRRIQSTASRKRRRFVFLPKRARASRCGSKASQELSGRYVRSSTVSPPERQQLNT